MNKLTQLSHRGFSVVEVVIIVVIVGVIGGAGYLVYSRQSDDSAKDTTTSEQVADDVPAIQSAEDLDTASQTIDDTNIDSVDAEADELDSSLADI